MLSLQTLSLSSQQYTFESPRLQEFALPGSFLQYISQEWSGGVYEKLIQSCKYFFARHQIVPLELLDSKNDYGTYYFSRWKYDEVKHQLLKGKVVVNVEEGKLWVRDRGICWCKHIKNLYSSFLEAVYRCTPINLTLWGQDIEIELLSKISETVQVLEIYSTAALNPDKSEASLWDILTLMPKLKKCKVDTTIFKKFSPLPGKTSTLPILPNLRGFEFFGLPEDDFPLFSEFIKLHPNTYFDFTLHSRYSNPQAFKAILEELFPTASIDQKETIYKGDFILTLDNRLICISIH